jgi:hypothetical protein
MFHLYLETLHGMYVHRHLVAIQVLSNGQVWTWWRVWRQWGPDMVRLTYAENV